VLPRSVVYDPTLTYGLPVKASVMSGLNAVAHAAEGLYAPDASPIISMMAEDGISKMLSALPRIASDPEDRAGRSDALYAAWLCGAVLGATTMGLHHKLCHILGGTFNLPHADTHTVVLPYVLAFNLSASPDARAAVQRAVGSGKPAGALRDLAVQLGGPTSLAELGMPSDGVSEVVRQAVDAPYSNPRDVTPGALTKLVTEAFDGAQPDEDY
jgi:maleylacetate reductase